MSIFLAFGAMQSSVSLSVLPFCGFRLIMILAPSGETDGYVRAWKKPPLKKVTALDYISNSFSLGQRPSAHVKANHLESSNGGEGMDHRKWDGEVVFY